MANRRMVVKELSYSAAFNSVSEFAQNLYFFTTPHLDDFGKVEGNPKTLKARVVPLSNRSPEDVEKAIRELVRAAIIDYYEVDGQKIIKYLTFEEDQTGLNKRTTSKYPDKPHDSKNFSEVQRSPYATEENRKEVNKSESNGREREYEGKPDYNIADKKYLDTSIKDLDLIDPYKFEPTNDAEALASELWKEFEPDNERAFITTYLYAVKVGMSSSEMFVAASEIRQDPTVKNKGALFRAKVSIWIAAQKSHT